MSKLFNVHLKVSAALADLERLFTPDMKLTFVARHPTATERHVIVTNDDVGLRDLFAQEAVKEAADGGKSK